MPEQYVHLLISKESEFAPSAEQVIGFCDGLGRQSASPLNAKRFFLKPTGRVRTFTDPLTGAKKSFPANDRIVFESTSDLVPLIGTLQQYAVMLDGEGPPPLSPFPLYFNDFPFTENYGYAVRCVVRPKPVSMSDVSAEEISSFGEPCGTDGRAGLFRHPVSNELIEVEGAGCARFWIEFEFGKWLLPQINHSLAILDSRIVALASASFGLEFSQGIHLL
jgi:hypothetical protein